MARPFSDMSADIDALYRLPFAEFTPGRNTLATRVRAEQGKEASAAIKALEKPSLSAWVVNQLSWRHRRDFDRLLRAGDALRASQQQRLAGQDADVNAAIDARREALAGLMATAAGLLQESGAGSPDILQRVATTLEALSVYGTSETAPRAGRLTEDVQPPGFAALAALVPAGPVSLSSPAAARPAGPGAKGPSSESSLRMVEPRRGPAGAARPAEKEPTKAEKAAERAAGKAAEKAAEKAAVQAAAKARAALEQTEADLAQARKAAQQAGAAQTRAQAAWDAAREALEAVQRTLDEAMERERAAQVARDERRRAATQATQAVGRAERARDEAERYLQSLSRG